MSEMVERVRAAIITALRDTNDGNAVARAAIAAMREPTTKMICAALDYREKVGGNDFSYTAEYNAMIDGALKS